ncbi:hypothetical protein AN403_4704 [Pseudomonas fluorescens]|uniref:Uncharacterized protein n=1 Tax=Pseudomonas fluorescens TaxID=294 RepID=A0A0N8NXN9_PSEFL|nr:hypothetical protein AN403_4704 [Pseudomonas fluorescens]
MTAPKGYLSRLLMQDMGCRFTWRDHHWPRQVSSTDKSVDLSSARRL